MDFDFSDELKQLREQARRMLAGHGGPRAARAVLDGGGPIDAPLWQRIAGLGWLGANIPERHGGSGLGPEALCILAEEIGRAVAPVPFSLTAGLAVDALRLAGSPAQQAHWLPRIANGSVVATLAVAEGPGAPRPEAIAATLAGGRLSGVKSPVAAGMAAHLAIVAVRAEGGIALVLAEPPAAARHPVDTLDPTLPHATLRFDATPADRLPGADWSTLQALLDRAAILAAFEQIGGAAACLESAVAYAKERHAFGRPIGSFQAIKHKLADVYVANELARSNAYYGAWALQADAAELALAAAAARVSASEAFHLAAKENIQTHGGMGFTWDSDCHLFYRRARYLALAFGAAPFWKQRLVSLLESRNAA